MRCVASAILGLTQQQMYNLSLQYFWIHPLGVFFQWWRATMLLWCSKGASIVKLGGLSSLLKSGVVLSVLPGSTSQQHCHTAGQTGWQFFIGQSAVGPMLMLHNIPGTCEGTWSCWKVKMWWSLTLLLHQQWVEGGGSLCSQGLNLVRGGVGGSGACSELPWAFPNNSVEGSGGCHM